jgi:O-antigen/teichoic acid export membrane protein
MLTDPSSARRRHGTAAFVFNVAWGWMGVAANVLVGLLLSPYVIDKLGAERFGIWVLVFTTLDYLRLFDFGFRAAIINFAARSRARQDDRGINEAINTGFFYLALCGLAILVLGFVAAPALPSAFNIGPELAHEASMLGFIVAAAVAINLAFSTFSGALEAVQRFDLVNHAYLAALIMRAAGSVVLLANGYGLVALGWLALGTQALERIWNLVSVHRVLPTFRFSVKSVRPEVLRQMAGYGVHSFLITTCNMILNQGPGAIIGLLSNPVQVAYFSVAMRLVLYVGEVVPRVGFVTAARTAEVSETGSAETVRNIGVYTNRYCLTAFVPLALFCAFYAEELLRVWINAEFAANGAMVLVILMIAVVITMAGQFNSGAILIGQARHRLYSYGLFAESVAAVVGVAWITPRYGIVGVAWYLGGLILLTRGLWPAWLLARLNGFSLGWYLSTIYVRPVLTAVPVAGLISVIKTPLPGRNWIEVIAAAAIIAVSYYLLALFTCLERRHRSFLTQLVSPRWLTARIAHP